MTSNPDEYHTYPLQDGAVVLRAGIPRLFLLNATARSFWNMHRAGVPRDEMAANWVRDYGLEDARAATELERLIGSLEQAGLLGPSRASAPKSPQVLPPARFRCGPTPPARACCNVVRKFSVQCSSLELEKSVNWLYAHLQAGDGPADTRVQIVEHAAGYVINIDDREVASIGGLDELLPSILFHVGELGRQDESQLLVLHAGAVARGGRCILLPALSGVGKSTLVAYLSHHGLDYLSDDMTPIDAASLEAEPAPTCLSIKAGSWEAVSQFRPDLMQRRPIPGASKVMRLLPPPPTDPAVWFRRYPVQAIVCPRFNAAAHTELVPLTPLELLQEIVESQAYFQQPLVPARVERLVHWMSEVRGYRLTYASLKDAAQQIEQLL